MSASATKSQLNRDIAADN
jgi:hypothetical protein